MFKALPEEFHGFCWTHCKGKGFIELPISYFHMELIELIQYSRVAVAAPRHFAKSTYFGKFFPLYKALEDEGSQSMIISATSQLAEEHLGHIKNDLITRESIIGLYGNQVTKHWRADEIKLKNGSKIFAKGAGKQIRGFHPNFVVVDDIETDEIVASSDRLKKLEHWFWTDVVGVLPADGQLILIGTLLHPESFLAQMVHKGRPGWERRFYQAITTDGDALWPDMWPLNELDRIRAEIGSVAFQQEYQNNPLPDHLRKFQKKWIHYFDAEPEGCLYFMTVDPAIETGDANDFSAVVICCMDTDENIYVVDYVNKRLLPSELIDVIFKKWEQYKCQSIGIETVGFQKMLKYEIDKQRRIRNRYPVVYELKSEGRRKSLRIEALQPRFECGKVFIKRHMSELETQLLRFPSPRCKDDIIDALAYQLEVIRPSKVPVIQVNPESFMAELERRRRALPGRSGFWGNHKLQRQ